MIRPALAVETSDNARAREHQRGKSRFAIAAGDPATARSFTPKSSGRLAPFTGPAEPPRCGTALGAGLAEGDGGG